MYFTVDVSPDKKVDRKLLANIRSMIFTMCADDERGIGFSNAGAPKEVPSLLKPAKMGKHTTTNKNKEILGAPASSRPYHYRNAEGAGRRLFDHALDSAECPTKII